MKLPITLLLLAAIGHAAHSRLPPASKTTNVNKTNKRELIEGNYGLRNGLSFSTQFGPTRGIEYAVDKDSLAQKSTFGVREPQISKISDLLTGHGPPFEVAIANHLYSPVSAYQARLSSPTTFDLPSDASQLRYPEHKLYKGSEQYSQQFEQNPQNNDPKAGYQPEYSREESKLLHLETAFPRLEPSHSTQAPLAQDLFIQPFSDINSQLYPQISYQHVEQIPFRYPDGSIQPTQYIQQSLVKLIRVQSESDNREAGRDEDNQQTERPKAVQISTETTNQNYNGQSQQLTSYESLNQRQPYAPSQQYLPEPQLSHLQAQDQYQLVSVEQSTPQPEDQLFQIQQRDNEYQQYQEYFQNHEQTPQTESPQQVVEINESTAQPAIEYQSTPQPAIEYQSTPQPAIEYQSTPQPAIEYQSTQEIQEPLPTEVEPAQPLTISTFKPFSDYSTTPKILESEDSSTTVTPYTTHKPLSRMPMAPLRPLPGSKRLPQPRPFSNTLPTTAAPTRFTTFSPLPAFRRFPLLNTRQPISPTLSTTFSSLPTITTTPQPYSTEITSTQPLQSTAAVSRIPIIRIRHKPSHNQLQSTTPQPTRPIITTLEPLPQPTSTFRPSTILEQETPSGLQTQTQRPDAKLGPEYLPPPELPPQPQPGVIYHLRSQSLAPSSPQPEPLYQPQHFQYQSLQPQLQVNPQPSPPPRIYSQQELIQPQQPHFQSFLPPGQIQLYQPPVFNLRPLYQPLSTPLPPLQATEKPQQKATVQRQPRPDAQEPRKLKPLSPKSKVLNGGETYLTPDTFVNPIQPILHPQLYAQSHELFIQPDYHHLAAPTFDSVQYFGKYAQSIFGHYRH